MFICAWYRMSVAFDLQTAMLRWSRGSEFKVTPLSWLLRKSNKGTRSLDTQQHSALTVGITIVRVS